MNLFIYLTSSLLHSPSSLLSSLSFYYFIYVYWGAIICQSFYIISLCGLNCVLQKCKLKSSPLLPQNVTLPDCWVITNVTSSYEVTKVGSYILVSLYKRGLENSMDGGAWWVAKSGTWLSDFTFTYTGEMRLENEGRIWSLSLLSP